MKENWYEFTNCGIRHVQNKVTYEIECDQTNYIDCLRPVVNVSLASLGADAPLTGVLYGMFLSLLGAAAYTVYLREQMPPCTYPHSRE